MAIMMDDMRWAWDVHWLTREDLRWSVRRLVERGESTDYVADSCQVTPETAEEWADEVARRRGGIVRCSCGRCGSRARVEEE